MAELTKGFASEKSALVDDHREMTWAELDSAVNKTVHALRGAGIGEGDTISIVSGNRNEWFVMSLACAHAGITFVPVNWHLVGPEIAYIVADSGSKAVLVDHLFLDEVERALTDERTSNVELANRPSRGSAARCSTPRVPPGTRRACAARSLRCRTAPVRRSGN